MATTQKVSPETILESLAAHPRLTAAKLAEVLGIGQSTAAKHLATLEVAGTARREPGGRDGGRRVADRWSATASAADDAANDGPVRSTDRLARGELGTLVRAYLAARPGEDHGSTQIGKALGRSQGAVSNALARLEVAGDAQLVSASPRRYRIAESR
jgi:DNA-binding MarR family transcriptional regulator